MNELAFTKAIEAASAAGIDTFRMMELVHQRWSKDYPGADGLEIQAGVLKDGTPRVEMRWGPMVASISPGSARAYGLMILDEAASSEMLEDITLYLGTLKNRDIADKLAAHMPGAICKKKSSRIRAFIERFLK